MMTPRYGITEGRDSDNTIYDDPDTGKSFLQAIVRASLTVGHGLIHDSVVRGVMTDAELSGVRQHASADVAPELYASGVEVRFR